MYKYRTQYFIGQVDKELADFLTENQIKPNNIVQVCIFPNSGLLLVYYEEE